jgi:hypothetical protein
VEWAAEGGQIKRQHRPIVNRRMRERCAYVFGRVFPTRFDKAVRAQSIRGRMALDGLVVPTQARWYPAFRAELLSFPAGKHDDQVDAMGLIGQLLDRMGPGRELPPPKKEEPMLAIGSITVDQYLQSLTPPRLRRV